MVVRNGQQLGLTLGQPLLGGYTLALRAVSIAAGVVGDARVCAVLATLDVTAERRRAAALDRRHDLQLAEAHMTDVGSTPRRSVAAEDIRDLQRRAGHASPASGRRLALLQLRGDVIERADDLADCFGGNPCVERRRVK